MNAGVELTSTIAGYRVIEQLYSGSRTLVYRAIREADAEDGSAKRRRQPVVIKILRRNYPTFNELLQFCNQYTIAKNLRQLGVVEPYSLEFYRNSYALVMEDFGGISLKEYVQTYDIELNEFLTVAFQLSEILNGLYCKRIIHKDIKSANILWRSPVKSSKSIAVPFTSILD
ncbi:MULTISPECIES: protein kinase [Aerosakkonema]|uniref:protein kinase n=1 Tax=Aerosakkonema TaxID=1246629 RepID=UPI0035BAA2B0